MKIKSYRNKRNEYKYIDVKHTNDRHYMWRQRMSWSNGVTNYLGGHPNGGFHRVSKRWMGEVMSDYTEVVR